MAQATVTLRVGVLALQGDVVEHLAVLNSLGVHSVKVRREDELSACDALVIPGGESTTIGRLARIFGLVEPIQQRIRAGMPVLGTCAGMIMLADRVLGATDDQVTFGGLDVTVRRNAFGRQVDSFEDDLEMAGITAPVRAVFIRAPWVEEVGPGVKVLARVESGSASGRIVAVRQGSLLATSFHPEVGGDSRVHGLFVDLVHRA